MRTPYGEWREDGNSSSGYSWFSTRHDDEHAELLAYLINPDALPAFDEVDSTTIVDDGTPD
jgi:hypothetical protein